MKTLPRLEENASFDKQGHKKEGKYSFFFKKLEFYIKKIRIK
jgi:hypothetical protein